MLEKLQYRVGFTVAARRDIIIILARSAKEFGAAAATRHEALIAQAVSDLRIDPDRLGSMRRPEVAAPGVRTYHLSFSRKRMTGIRVRSPRHFILYRSSAPGLIEIGRVLDESMDFVRHLPEKYRHSGDENEETWPQLVPQKCRSYAEVALRSTKITSPVHPTG